METLQKFKQCLKNNPKKIIAYIISHQMISILFMILKGGILGSAIAIYFKVGGFLIFITILTLLVSYIIMGDDMFSDD